MMHVVRLAWRMLLRDRRAGELNFLVLSMIVAVGVLASVGFFVDRMRTALERDAHQLLGADVVISSDQPLPPSWGEEVRRRQLVQAHTLTFPSMASAGEGDQALSRLVDLKAVEAGYPLRGHLTTSEHLASESGSVTDKVVTRDVPRHGEAWADSAVAQALHLRIGQSLKLGDSAFVLKRVIVNEPDRGATVFNIAPRVMIAMADIPATHLVQDTSRVGFHLQVASDASDAPARTEQFKQWCETRIKESNLRGIRVESLQNGNPQMRATIDRAGRFLSLVALLSAMLAAIAIAMAARRFMLRHIDACAMLRCLGMPQREVLLMYVIEFLMVGLFASACGVVFGYLAQEVLMQLLGQLVTADPPAAGWVPAVQAFGSGMVLLLGFVLPPILQLRNVPHNQVIRRDQPPPGAASWLGYMLGASAFTGLLLWLAGDVKLGLLTGLGFLAGLAVFALLGWLTLLGVQTLRPYVSAYELRFAMTSISRRVGLSVVQIVAVAIGLMALLLLTVVRNELLSAWHQATPADAPDHFVINIQPDQKQAFEQQLVASGVSRATLYPMIRGRLVDINGVRLRADSYSDPRAKGLAEREFNLSTMRDLPPSNAVVAGQWLQQGQPGASVEVGIAQTLKLKLGDRLTFDVAGQRVTVPITSLRKLDWGSMRVNFFVILDAGSAQGLPETYVTAFHAPKPVASNLPDIETSLTQVFPNLTVIDVSGIIAQLQSILDQVSTAVEFLFLFALVSGMLVLYAALTASQDERMREAAILRSLGATNTQLQRTHRIEFILTGCLAGALAAFGAAMVGWLLARQVFDFEWHFQAMVWLAGLLSGIVCVYMGGRLGLRRVLNSPPLQTLRSFQA